MRAQPDSSKLILSLALALTALLPPAGWAQGALQEGIKLYGEKNYRAALSKFSAALSGGNSPTVLYYAALCYSQLGDAAHAKQYFDLVRTNYPGSPEAPLALQGIKLLDTPPPVEINAATSTAPPKSEKKAPPPFPSAKATSKEVGDYVTDFEISDEEWKQLPDEAKVPFERGTSSHMFVNGYVNGRPLRMMFDTGASNCAFYRKDLEAAGVKIDPSGPRMRIGGVAGSSGAQIMMADVQLGPLKRRIPIVVSDTSFGFSLIGQTFFKEFKYNIDNGSGFIDFVKKPRAGLTSSSRVYESTDVVKVPFEPMGNNMVVRVKINGKTVPMFFDTGSYAITMSMLAAPYLGIQIPDDAQRVGSAGVGGVVTGYKVYVDRIELGPIVKTHVPVILNGSMSPSLLGQPFFGDRKYTIDNENHTINFVH